jgi:crotonobetainyl-CoA:carnitine CoA-transferase CaiB-like acyl-CoA transferase
MQANMLANGALTGIKVLDLSRLLPGPYCSMILADHGAEVIAIEDVRFCQDALFFNDINRNKRHMSLNLKTEEGLGIFFQLARDADVILEGFRPGVVARLGVDYDAVKKINPRVIYCSISGYGQTGECRNLVGHDVNYLSRAGILSICGEKDRLPAIPGVQIGDIAGGSMNAAIGILLALYAREKTGVGQYIDIAMTDGLLGFLVLSHFFARREQQPAQRGYGVLTHRYACYNVYQTRDNRYFSIGAVENRFWKNLCVLIGRPQYTDDQYDDGRQHEIIADLRALFAGENLTHWYRLFADADVCFAAISNPEETWEDPLFHQREMVHRYYDSKGQEQMGIGIPVKMSDTPGSIRSIPAEFGADTEAILGEYGYSMEQLRALREQGVIWSPLQESR